MCWEMRRYTL